MPSTEQAELLATPCVPCRENHLKCDRLVPTCGRCAQSGRECKLAFKFKASKGTFRKNQKWLRAPSRLTFVNETPRLVSGESPRTDPGDATQDGASSPVRGNSPSGLAGEAPSVLSGHVSSGEAPAVLAGDTPPPLDDMLISPVGPHYRRDSPSNRFIFPRPDRSVPTTATDDSSTELHGTSISLSPSGTNFTHPSDGQLSIPSCIAQSLPHNAPSMPLMSRPEAELFRHYIQRLATCLDLCDPLRHFELVVPQRAGVCRTLLNAIFALAARHLSQTSGYDPLASNRYHDECLSSLIPMLNHACTVADENLFAATIILRMLEEIDAPTMGQNYGHLLGIHAFVNVGEQVMIPGSLSAASYWVGLRQEIYSAISTQSPVKMSLEHFIVDRSFEEADDYTWSNRAVVNLADVLNFCFAQNSALHSSTHWGALNDECNRWDQMRPTSFDPFYYKKRIPPQAFPEVWHHSSCHIIGIQHHILAQLFLAQFDPNIPRVGTKRTAAMKRVTHQIEYYMRELCGIGASNQWTPPALFTASMGIAMFGDRFEERADQEALIDILQKTEENHARPTEAVQQQLMRVWGWIPDYDE